MAEYKSQHMLAGLSCTMLSIIIFVIIITTERELDQETCREGVDAVENERKNNNNKKCLCSDVSVVMCIFNDSGMKIKFLLPQLN